VLCGFFLWLEFACGIAYLGHVPTVAFYLLPCLAGCWFALWPQRCRARPYIRVLALATAVELVVVGASVVLQNG